jgi:hypothetical protein
MRAWEVIDSLSGDFRVIFAAFSEFVKPLLSDPVILSDKRMVRLLAQGSRLMIGSWGLNGGLFLGETAMAIS